MKQLFKSLLPLCLVLLAGCLLVFLYMSNRQETARLNEESRKAAPGRFVRLEHGLVHYRLSGPANGKLVVLIHGGGATGMEVWKYNLPYLLSRGYRVLAYDLYGRGYSDRPHLTYDTALFRRQLASLLDSLGIRQQFDIVAMSMGAVVALDFANAYPGRARKIALLAPAVGGDLKPSRLLRVPLVSQLLMTCYWYPRSIENQRREFVNQRLFNSYARRLAYFMNFKGYKYITHSTWLHFLNQDQLPLFRQIPPSSVLLVYGRQDPYFPEENVARYKGYYPTMEVHAVDSAGHMPHYEQPEQVNALLAKFLEATSL